MTAALSVDSLWKIFGPQADAIMKSPDAQLSRKELQEKSVWKSCPGYSAKLETSPDAVTSVFTVGPVVYGFQAPGELGLANARTVHKAQGSEYPAVVMVMHSTHYIMLKRNLLYTALTRAERLAVIIGDRKGLYKAVKTADEKDRYTRLAARLTGELPHEPIQEHLHFE